MYFQESQGYKRTESDAHLIFDFKKARSVFDKNDENDSNKKVNSTDPSLLSVAERRKLFERRLRVRIFFIVYFRVNERIS